MSPTVLIVTSRESISAGSVISHLEEMGQRYLRLNTDDFPTLSKVRLSLLNGVLDGEIICPGSEKVPLSDIKSVWYRKPMPPDLGGRFRDDFARFAENEARATLWSLYTTSEALWVNPPLFGVRLLEDNKLYQLKIAGSVGLSVPRTIISNDVNDLLGFIDKCDGVAAVKTIYMSAFVDDEDNVFFVYTNQVTREDLVGRDEEIGLCPVMLQEYIEKEVELRITIVGNQVFACAIYSQDSERTLHDWRRYDFDNVEHHPHNLPDGVKQNLISLMKELRLVYGAVDMILTPSGQYVFLEVNPGGQWGWIEDLTGLPISRSLAEILSEER